MVRRCTDADCAAIEAIINEAAQAYRGVIPADCWHEPYMPRRELVGEINAGVEFWGWQESGTLVGVMGLQHVRDVTLVRHAYVLSAHQGRGVGRALLHKARGPGHGAAAGRHLGRSGVGHPLLPEERIPSGPGD
jgi:GNAT superfamily N-acetyltransferase